MVGRTKNTKEHAGPLKSLHNSNFRGEATGLDWKPCCLVDLCITDSPWLTRLLPRVAACLLWGSAHKAAVPATHCLLHSWHESKASHRYKNARCQAVKWSRSSVLPQVRHFYVTISGWHFDVSFWTHSSVSKWTCEHVKPIVLSYQLESRRSFYITTIVGLNPVMIMVDFHIYFCCWLFFNFYIADFPHKYKILRESSQYKVSADVGLWSQTFEIKPWLHHLLMVRS